MYIYLSSIPSECRLSLLHISMLMFCCIYMRIRTYVRTRVYAYFCIGLYMYVCACLYTSVCVLFTSMYVRTSPVVFLQLLYSLVPLAVASLSALIPSCLRSTLSSTTLVKRPPSTSSCIDCTRWCLRTCLPCMVRPLPKETGRTASSLHS